MGEEEEGHCHNQVETPICGCGNTETEAELTKKTFFLEILKQTQNFKKYWRKEKNILTEEQITFGKLKHIKKVGTQKQTLHNTKQRNMYHEKYILSQKFEYHFAGHWSDEALVDMLLSPLLNFINFPVCSHTSAKPYSENCAKCFLGNCAQS